MHLAYDCEAESVRDRLTRKLFKLEAKLGEDGEKPKWMRRRTYERIWGQIGAAEDARLVAFIGALRQTVKRLRLVSNARVQ
jgi:hypothetical protein